MVTEFTDSNFAQEVLNNPGVEIGRASCRVRV